MPQCRNCESHVTEQFARVFGDNNDCVHNCIDCATNRALYDGAASADGGWSDAPVPAWTR